MIRLVSCIRRKQGVSPVEFRKYWDSPQFQVCINNMANTLNAIRGVKYRTLHVEANMLAQQLRESEVEPFDGMIEYWWKSAQDFQGLLAGNEVPQALKEMKVFQEQFVDSANCSIFFTESDD